ncbi:MAG: sigma-70 family RNA polymerase sigma factor [Gammaproteobacteria bacterium]|nr:sigma-70 family RNA polymerase sigma factor [Gammaproteobacteria bacterium]
MNELYRDIEAQIPRLRRYARALLGDHTRADDLVQDTLERALSRLHLWRRGSDLRAWLFSIMHSIYVNEVRRSQRWARVVMDGAELDPSLAAHQDEPLALHDMLSALARLPDEFRAVVLLVGLEEMSYKEAAGVLGIPVGTVMSRLARGRERLRALMSGERPPALRRVK